MSSHRQKEEVQNGEFLGSNQNDEKPVVTAQ